MATTEELIKHGFQITGGQIDRDNVNYGFLSSDGPVLTSDGEDLLARLKVKGRRKVADVVAETLAELKVTEVE